MTPPREKDTIYNSVKNSLQNNIPELTNFTENSFNWVWNQAFAEEIRDLELDSTAATMEGFIDYAGGPVNEDDLRRLGIDDATTPSEMNERLAEANLEELVKIVSVERSEGSLASGEVTITTSSDYTEIPEGMSVGTLPDPDGDFLEYVTVQSSSTEEGETTATVQIEAEEVGSEYNVGAGNIINLPSPPSGIRGVNNFNSISGGEDREQNDELRERAKRSLFKLSGGGTKEGVAGYVEENVESVAEAEVEEMFTGDSWHNSHPHGHLIVDGGEEGEIRQAVNESRPVAMRHYLVRPSIINLDADIEVTGDDIDTDTVETEAARYFDLLQLGDDVQINRIIQRTLNAGPNIRDVEAIDLLVNNETKFFDAERLDRFEDGNTGIENKFWNDWSGDTGSFTARDDDVDTVISGEYSGRLRASGSGTVSVSTTRNNMTTQSFEITSYLDVPDPTANSGDYIEFIFYSSGTEIARFRAAADGSEEFPGSTTTSGSIGQHTENTEVKLGFSFDFDNDEFTTSMIGEFDSVSHRTGSLVNAASGWDEVEILNRNTVSSNTRTLYIDDLILVNDTQEVELSDKLVSGGVSAVTDGNGNTYTQGQDWETVDGSGDGNDDSIRWMLGRHPSYTTETRNVTFRSGVSSYLVDNGMRAQTVSDVRDTGGTTYDKGTDYEEADTANNGTVDGIQWLDGGDRPSDGREFSVTYDRSVPAFVDYDILNEDISLTVFEKANAGGIDLIVR